MKTHTKRRLKLVAVVAVVLLTLTGFSHTRTSGGGGGKSRGGSSSGGGGCGRDDSSSGSRYNSGYYNGSGSSSSGGSGSSSRDRDREPDARIVKCLAEDGKTVVELRSRGETETFHVSVDFLDETGSFIESGREQVRLRAGQTKRFEVEPEDPDVAPRVAKCEIGSVI